MAFAVAAGAVAPMLTGAADADATAPPIIRPAAKTSFVIKPVIALSFTR
jgi:hypothetical protein